MPQGYDILLNKLLSNGPSAAVIVVCTIMLAVWLSKIGLHFRRDLDAVKSDIIRILTKLGLHEGTPEDEKNVVACKRDFIELESHLMETMRKEFRPWGECEILHNGIKEHIRLLDNRVDGKRE